MAKIQHPSSLNPWQQYHQACSILKNTSRASNPAWYQQAPEQDYQLHIRAEGVAVVSSYYDRKSGQWSDGPKLTEDILHKEDAFQPILEEILKQALSANASSLGVVLHIADDFATAELNPDFDNPAVLNELRKKAVDEPGSILEDATIDKEATSCRIVPYAAAGSASIGTTVVINRDFAPFTSALREIGEKNNFPIITQSLSAPLVAMMGLGGMLPSQPDKPFVGILQYSWFTVLAFFNEHGDLKLIRTLQHRGIRKANNLRNALFTSSTSLEFLDPDLFIVPLGSEIDTELADELRQHFRNCRIEALIPPAADGVPEYCAELLIVNQTGQESAATSLTFTSLREDGWALQDFLPKPREQAEIHPLKSEMRLLRMTRLIRVAVVILALSGLGYFGLGITSLIRMPEWDFNPDDAGTAKARLNMLNEEKLRISYWESMLADRSKAWVVMEAFARMFPEGGNMLVQDMKYTAKPDNTQGQTMVGFVKVWKISGLARDEALTYLNTLNTRDGIHKYFSHMADITGSTAYRPDVGNRNISVNVRTRENNSFRLMPPEEMVMTDVASYPFSFDLTITQRFEATDPMAINVKAAP